uniref:Uncharacterized protein LOC104247861 n=1 Tax=Nicotiana sylvestris TaxID=4096 RepID=A0A1U7YDT9_NICSY
METSQMNKEMSTLERKISVLEEKLKQVQLDLNADLFNEQFLTTEKELLVQLEKWAIIHEQVLRQKSRATWLRYGDSNTKYFHANIESKALKDLRAEKAPVIDGFPVECFKQYWNLIGKEETKATIQFFQNGKLLKEVNFITVTLVPK